MMDDMVRLTVNIEGVGEKQISFQMKEVVEQIKVEHLMRQCPEGHNEADLSDEYFDCDKCRGTNFILEPAGEVFAALIKRQGLRISKELLWMEKD